MKKVYIHIYSYICTSVYNIKIKTSNAGSLENILSASFLTCLKATEYLQPPSVAEFSKLSTLQSGLYMKSSRLFSFLLSYILLILQFALIYLFFIVRIWFPSVPITLVGLWLHMWLRLMQI